MRDLCEFMHVCSSQPQCLKRVEKEEESHDKSIFLGRQGDLILTSLMYADLSRRSPVPAAALRSPVPAAALRRSPVPAAAVKRSPVPAAVLQPSAVLSVLQFYQGNQVSLP